MVRNVFVHVFTIIYGVVYGQEEKGRGKTDKKPKLIILQNQFDTEEYDSTKTPYLEYIEKRTT